MRRAVGVLNSICFTLGAGAAPLAAILFAVFTTALASNALAQAPPPELPPGVMERPPELINPAPPLPQNYEPPPPGAAVNEPSNDGAHHEFKAGDTKKLRLLKHVPGPECTPEQWAAGQWYKGEHDKGFGWWWIANGVWYRYKKPTARVPDYATRTILVYDDTFDNGAKKKRGPTPASVQSASFSSSAPGLRPAIPPAPANVPANVPANKPIR